MCSLLLQYGEVSNKEEVLVLSRMLLPLILPLLFSGMLTPPGRLNTRNPNVYEGYMPGGEIRPSSTLRPWPTTTLWSDIVDHAETNREKGLNV